MLKSKILRDINNNPFELLLAQQLNWRANQQEQLPIWTSLANVNYQPYINYVIGLNAQGHFDLVPNGSGGSTPNYLDTDSVKWTIDTTNNTVKANVPQNQLVPYQRYYYMDGKLGSANDGDVIEVDLMGYVTGSIDGGSLQDWEEQFDKGEFENAFVIDRTNNIFGRCRDTENSTYFHVVILKTNIGSSGSSWGSITGNLLDQTDLAEVLANKMDTFATYENKTTSLEEAAVNDTITGTIDFTNLETSVIYPLGIIQIDFKNSAGEFGATLEIRTTGSGGYIYYIRLIQFDNEGNITIKLLFDGLNWQPNFDWTDVVGINYKFSNKQLSLGNQIITIGYITPNAILQQELNAITYQSYGYVYWNGISLYNYINDQIKKNGVKYQRFYFADGKLANTNLGDIVRGSVFNWITASIDGDALQDWEQQFNNGEGEGAIVIDRTNNITGKIRDVENNTVFNCIIIAKS